MSSQDHDRPGGAGKLDEPIFSSIKGISALPDALLLVFRAKASDDGEIEGFVPLLLQLDFVLLQEHQEHSALLDAAEGHPVRIRQALERSLTLSMTLCAALRRSAR